MGIFLLQNDERKLVDHNGRKRTIITNEGLVRFSPEILGLGDIRLKSTQKDAICAFIDLEGFTNFCKQVDPYLILPSFLSSFLEFVFHEIKMETLKDELPEGCSFWHDLPFFIKFMGDGLMILWDSESVDDETISNIVMSMSIICDKYTRRFFSSLKTTYSDAPERLRCGMARGHIYTVGNGQDYIGPCINIAARLCKFLPNVVVARRGINIVGKPAPFFITKMVTIRGIGSNELIYVDKQAFHRLSEDDQLAFRDP